MSRKETKSEKDPGRGLASVPINPIHAILKTVEV